MRRREMRAVGLVGVSQEEWPSDTRTPFSLSLGIALSAPGTSGASVTTRTAGSSRSTQSRSMLPEHELASGGPQ